MLRTLIKSIPAMLLLITLLASSKCAEGPGLQPEPSAPTDTSATPTAMFIAVSDGSRTVVFRLNGTPVARSLYDQLPIEVPVSDYSTNEKVFSPPAPLSTIGGIESDCPVGTMAYFAPWRNVAMYYGPASRYSGLYIVGEATEGVEHIAALAGTIRVTQHQ
ncbi:MAG: hypothetical protein IJU72_09320 [Bacteroidales bacterium]|nr:hypothetical protein [Bacteroidales bacterium]